MEHARQVEEGGALRHLRELRHQQVWVEKVEHARQVEEGGPQHRES